MSKPVWKYPGISGFFSLFFTQLYECGPILKVTLKYTSQGILSSFFFLFALNLAGQLFKIWYNQTAPTYIGYFKKYVRESLFLCTLTSQFRGKIWDKLLE